MKSAYKNDSATIFASIITARSHIGIKCYSHPGFGFSVLEILDFCK